MKRIYLIIIGFIIYFSSYASTSLNWNNNIVECPSSKDSSNITMYGVPNFTGLVASTGSSTCNNRYYYNDDYTKTFTANLGINTCNSGDKVIKISPNPCISGSCTITCRKGFDTQQDINIVTNDLTTKDLQNTRLKVYGNVGTRGNGSNITNNQKGNVLVIKGGFDKASLKKDIKSNAIKIVSSIKQTTTSLGSCTYDKIYNLNTLSDINNCGGIITGNKKEIFLNKKDGKVIELGNGTDMQVSGKKTIVIYGADLYINSSMYYSNKNSDILGIIVLKNSNGKGGNILINPNVTNIVGTFFAEKSILSASVSNLSTSQNITYYNGASSSDKLRNQLYIYGSIFSENTIGGSDLSTPKCPYYVSSCSKNEAIKYDLNFIRNYYLVEEKNSSQTNVIIPYNNGRMIGGGTCDDESGICSGFSSNLDKFINNGSILSSSTANAGYSTIIKYNPLISTNPPSLFTKN